MNGKRNIYIRNRPEVPIDFTISDFLKVYPIKLASFDVNICNGEHKKMSSKMKQIKEDR